MVCITHKLIKCKQDNDLIEDYKKDNKKFNKKFNCNS